jgi:EAL domain-containing protein (putative c-di-GMP-specific phosphodiesterase class I)/FixJ family two-component response regulator
MPATPDLGPIHTLLYVEDNPANRKLVEQIIARRADIRLLTAVNGNSGIESARVSQPDVILMDINLPDISGFKALNILRSDPTTADIPVIALSANATRVNIESGLRAGFFRYLTKPIKVNEFMEVLDVALEFAGKQSAKADRIPSNRASTLMDDAGKGMAAHLQKALREGHFVLYCQAIVPVAASDNELVYQEIFLRLKEEEEKMIPPGTFLPLFEEHKLLPLLDRWVVMHVLKWNQSYAATHAGSRVPRSSINLSMDTVRDPSFANYVLKQIEASGVPAEALSFEIPELHATANIQFLSGLIPPLYAAGCSFALSGFTGAGAAFELAASFGISIIKIDYSMISAISTDATALRRLSAINRHCHEVGMHTVCETVEDAATLNVLRDIQVDYAQGFGIAHPKILI